MPDPVPAEPRLVKVPLAEARVGDHAVVLNVSRSVHYPSEIVSVIGKVATTPANTYCLNTGESTRWPGYRVVAVYRLTTEPATPDPRAADAEAMGRLDRWARQHTTGARVVIEFTPSFAGGEEFYEAILCDSIVEGRGKVVFDKAPTLAAAIMSALDAAGAPQ